MTVSSCNSHHLEMPSSLSSLSLSWMRVVAMTVVLVMHLLVSNASADIQVGGTSIMYTVQASGTVYEERLNDCYYAFFSPIKTIRGNLKVVDGETACSPNFAQPFGDEILMTYYGSCAIHDLVSRAEALGASGLVVIDYARNGGVIVLSDDSDDDNSIPLDFLSASCSAPTGTRIASLLNDPGITNVNITISPVGNGDLKATPYTQTAVFILVCIVVLCVGFLYCHVMASQRRQDPYDIPNIELNGNITEDRKRELVEMMELKAYSIQDGEDAPTCAICIEDFQADDAIRVLPCRHEFHSACVDQWIVEHDTCPLCKDNSIEAMDSVIFGSQNSHESETNMVSDDTSTDDTINDTNTNINDDNTNTVIEVENGYGSDGESNANGEYLTIGHTYPSREEGGEQSTSSSDVVVINLHS
eukprot:m.15657 g.15657  ORF g.15657 m.15657 type:complete len:416 (+) comp4507_c0_seq1:153-1400(+)